MVEDARQERLPVLPMLPRPEADQEVAQQDPINIEIVSIADAIDDGHLLSFGGTELISVVDPLRYADEPIYNSDFRNLSELITGLVLSDTVIIVGGYGAQEDVGDYLQVVDEIRNIVCDEIGKASKECIAHRNPILFVHGEEFKAFVKKHNRLQYEFNKNLSAVLSPDIEITIADVCRRPHSDRSEYHRIKNILSEKHAAGRSELNSKTIKNRILQEWLQSYASRESSFTILYLLRSVLHFTLAEEVMGMPLFGGYRDLIKTCCREKINGPKISLMAKLHSTAEQSTLIFDDIDSTETVVPILIARLLALVKDEDVSQNRFETILRAAAVLRLEFEEMRKDIHQYELEARSRNASLESRARANTELARYVGAHLLSTAQIMKKVNIGSVRYMGRRIASKLLGSKGDGIKVTMGDSDGDGDVDIDAEVSVVKSALQLIQLGTIAGKDIHEFEKYIKKARPLYVCVDEKMRAEGLATRLEAVLPMKKRTDVNELVIERLERSCAN